MTKYIHEQPDWPRFRWSMEALAQRLANVRHKQGYLLGRMQVDLFKMGQANLKEAVELYIESFGQKDLPESTGEMILYPLEICVSG